MRKFGRKLTFPTHLNLGLFTVRYIGKIIGGFRPQRLFTETVFGIILENENLTLGPMSLYSVVYNTLTE